MFRRSTHGRSRARRRSGPRSGGSAAWWRRSGRGGRRGTRSSSGSTGWRRRTRRWARGGSPARGSTSPRTCCATTTTATRSSSGTSAGASGALSHRELRREVAARRGRRSRALGVRARRPGRRLPAQPARDRHRDAGHGQPRRDLVVLLARLRRQRRARSLRPDPARSARSARTAIATPARRSTRSRGCARCASGSRGSSGWSSCPTSTGRPDLGALPGAVRWDELLDAHRGQDRPAFARLPFDHPLYIMYSSGTTGLPKCMVHGAGGTLLQHLKELVLHTDLGPRRPDLLLHHLRLDDVELAGLRARGRRDGGAVRRRAARRRRRSCGTWPPRSG